MRLIGIDLDGTLEDSRDDMVAAAHRVREALGLSPRPDDALRPFVNAGMDTLYRACFDDHLAGGGAERLDAVRDAYEADYLAHVADHTRLYDGVEAALGELSELGALACVTNKPEHISRHLLDTLGVGERFATVVGGDTCAEAKPSPQMLSAAAERCGVSPADSFMIGDTDGDLRMARAFGAASIWCAWGYVEAPTEPADHRAAHPRELAPIVRSAHRG